MKISESTWQLASTCPSATYKLYSAGLFADVSAKYALLSIISVAKVYVNFTTTFAYIFIVCYPSTVWVLLFYSILIKNLLVSFTVHGTFLIISMKYTSNFSYIYLIFISHFFVSKSISSHLHFLNYMQFYAVIQFFNKNFLVFTFILYMIDALLFSGLN